MKLYFLEIFHVWYCNLKLWENVLWNIYSWLLCLIFLSNRTPINKPWKILQMNVDVTNFTLNLISRLSVLSFSPSTSSPVNIWVVSIFFIRSKWLGHIRRQNLELNELQNLRLELLWIVILRRINYILNKLIPYISNNRVN